MKIQCDVCEKASATVICCADEAALCATCDVEVHAANKLASKHQRLLLNCLTNKLPSCDICQEKTAFIFCVEDRALFCKDCDQPIHAANSRAANHQRFLATGIRVGLSGGCNTDSGVKSNVDPKPPKLTSQLKQQLEFNELEWLTDMNLFGEEVSDEALAAAEVPQLPLSQPSNMPYYRPSRFYAAHKKPRIETREEEDEEFFTVPDLG
ncbi:B-box zinc finger protein 25 [Phtheirospermum japonicum]|uniref:B-box zinc finger protein 25 n=1 Tax=Phtheirospermum japonicum TaxID=374723 RepID=A0A830C959_9LAMI|nr:B-box zinc finger protein 25 [Phtheirospermum japonicum]